MKVPLFGMTLHLGGIIRLLSVGVVVKSLTYSSNFGCVANVLSEVSKLWLFAAFS
jgi:hypothetical protein